MDINIYIYIDSLHGYFLVEFFVYSDFDFRDGGECFPTVSCNALTILTILVLLLQLQSTTTNNNNNICGNTMYAGYYFLIFTLLPSHPSLLHYFQIVIENINPSWPPQTYASS